MRKIITLLALSAMTIGASAQAYIGNKFFDNWSLGVEGGAVTALTSSHDIDNTSKAWASGKFIKGARPVFGLQLTKKIIPAFSLSIQDHAAINWTDSKTAIDYNDLALLGKVNLMNFFGGYLGKPRVFEIDIYAGAGWRYYYNHNCNYVNNAAARHYVPFEGVSGEKETYTKGETLEEGRDSWFTKAGADLLFNLGQRKIWTLAVRPAVIWDMDGFSAHHANGSRFQKQNMSFELTAGLVYNFLTSNGEHHFTTVVPRDQAEVDGLNAQINDLRGQVSDKDAQLDAAARQIQDLQNEINACRNRKPIVKEVVKQDKNMESIVSFRFDKSVIDRSQMPNVQRVADYMKSHADAKVLIKGYCSPEGTTQYNKGLSQRRSASVKNCLIKTFGIAADRIETAGEGVGKLFSEPSWNRVAIITILED